MGIFLALLFPIIAVIGFDPVYQTIRLIWQHRRYEAERLEARFEFYMRRIWRYRWQILIWSAMYLSIGGIVFTFGVIGHNPLFVSMGGLAISLYLWITGLAIRTVVDIRQRIDNHNHESLALIPPEFAQWLQGLNILNRPFRLTASDAANQKKLLDKIEAFYTYALIVTLSYTFWLSIFPTTAVWGLTIILFVGVILWIILSHLLGGDNKMPLRALKLLITLTVLDLIKVTLVVALFPKFSLAWEDKIKPQLEQNITNLFTKWVTPANAGNLNQPNGAGGSGGAGGAGGSGCTGEHCGFAGVGESTGGSAGKSGKANSDNAGANNASGGDSSPSIGSSKKKPNHGDYLDAHMQKLCKDFPDLENCKLVKTELTLPIAAPPATTTTPAVAPSPATNDTLTPFGLPPVKQLP